MRCITCNKQTFPLCQNCRKNPYFVEKARRFLAEKGDLKNLTALYFMKYAVLKDENTDKFWDLNFSDFVSLDEEDSVTKEKIIAQNREFCRRPLFSLFARPFPITSQT